MAKKPTQVASQSLDRSELDAQGKILRRIATNAVREACEVRRGRLTPRALLAYQWLTEPGTKQQTWTLAWVCLELEWDYENWRAKALAYVHKNWRTLAWRGFMSDLEARSRQVRALAEGTSSGYLPLVELSYWHEIANVDLPDSTRGETAFRRRMQAVLQFEEGE